jgi:ABC-type multidrug transport system fused ATPase/permease subunit
MSFAVTLREDIATTEVPLDFFKWMGLYVGVSMAASLMGTLRFFLVRWASLRFSQAMFQNMLAAILGAPLRWVDTVPLGRVLNRLTTDMFTMDIALGTNLAELLVWALQILAVVVASVMVSPYVLIPAALLLSISLRFAFLYLKAAREAKRLESVTRSPILEHFTSSITGLTTIRAFGLTSTYLQAMFTKMDHFSKISWSVWLFKWWIQLRIGFLGAIFAAAIAFLIIRLGVSASLCGFAISFVLQYSQAVSDAIGSYSTFEMDMTALERVAEYANVGSEPQEGLEPPAFWPTQGRIEVENLTVRYAPELPAALEDLTFSIENNERIGIVGRTGSGKSTLALALFRFIEASSGTFRVDGLDACAMKLTALRRAMALVPQHPTLFAGTIKLNLDPRGIHSDLELDDALRRVHLTSDRATGLQSFALNSPVAEGGRNFSQGQRQLICLARAILQRPKIMILDEASSSVDAETDSLMQETIRVEFGRNMSTLLVIAHRLSSVADFDKILVLDHGKLVEFDSPRNLLAREGGVFHELVQRSGDREALQKSILGATP